MNKIDLEETFRNSEDYQNLSDNMKEYFAHIYLEDITLSKESLNDLIALDRGEITHDEFIRQTFQEAKSKDNDEGK